MSNTQQPIDGLPQRSCLNPKCWTMAFTSCFRFKKNRKLTPTNKIRRNVAHAKILTDSKPRPSSKPPKVSLNNLQTENFQHELLMEASMLTDQPSIFDRNTKDLLPPTSFKNPIKMHRISPSIHRISKVPPALRQYSNSSLYKGSKAFLDKPKIKLLTKPSSVSRELARIDAQTPQLGQTGTNPIKYGTNHLPNKSSAMANNPQLNEYIDARSEVSNWDNDFAEDSEFPNGLLWNDNKHENISRTYSGNKSSLKNNLKNNLQRPENLANTQKLTSPSYPRNSDVPRSPALFKVSKTLEAGNRVMKDIKTIDSLHKHFIGLNKAREKIIEIFIMAKGESFRSVSNSSSNTLSCGDKEPSLSEELLWESWREIEAFIIFCGNKSYANTSGASLSYINELSSCFVDPAQQNYYVNKLWSTVYSKSRSNTTRNKGIDKPAYINSLSKNKAGANTDSFRFNSKRLRASAASPYASNGTIILDEKFEESTLISPQLLNNSNLAPRDSKISHQSSNSYTPNITMREIKNLNKISKKILSETRKNLLTYFEEFNAGTL